MIKFSSVLGPAKVIETKTIDTWKMPPPISSHLGEYKILERTIIDTWKLAQSPPSPTANPNETTPQSFPCLTVNEKWANILSTQNFSHIEFKHANGKTDVVKLPEGQPCSIQALTPEDNQCLDRRVAQAMEKAQQNAGKK